MQPLVEVRLEVLEALEAVAAVVAYDEEAVQVAGVAAGRVVGVVVVGVDQLAHLARVYVHLAVELVQSGQTLGAVDAALLADCLYHFRLFAAAASVFWECGGCLARL